MLENASQPQPRRAVVRRAVQLEAEILCDLWDRPIALPARNLSTAGIWVETQLPLSPGEELIVSFVPPGGQRAEPVVLAATVCRADLQRRKRDGGASGMALRFIDVEAAQTAALDLRLRGLPPPLPTPRSEEETSLRLADELEVSFTADAGLLGGGPPHVEREVRGMQPPRVRCFTPAYTPRRPALLRLRLARGSRRGAGRRPFSRARQPVHVCPA